MKFAIVLAAFVACAAASAIPLAWPLSHGSVAHHVALAPLAHSWAAPITQYSSIDLHAAPAAAIIAPHAIHSAPILAHSAPIVHAPIVHAPLALAHSASYTAKNRGAIHTAPLPGHAVSQTSLNLAPAPGTL